MDITGHYDINLRARIGQHWPALEKAAFNNNFNFSLAIMAWPSPV